MANIDMTTGEVDVPPDTRCAIPLFGVFPSILILCIFQKNREGRENVAKCYSLQQGQWKSNVTLILKFKVETSFVCSCVIYKRDQSDIGDSISLGTWTIVQAS